MSWPKKPLAEVADFQLGKMLDQVKNRGDSRPYLANKNVRWGNFDFSELREMRFEESEFERFSLKNGDIVMCEGGEPGRCAIWRDELPNMMFQKALHRIRPFEGMDSVFLYYNLSHRARSGHFNGLLTGATIKHLPREKLALVQVDVPDLPTQQRIAGILSAYDDLIENNRRRIGLLEQAARLLYREWFVHLRFPGHETAKIVDGLPEGWELTGIKKAYYGLYDGPHATPKPSEEGPVFLGIKNIREVGGVDLSEIRHVSEDEYPQWTRRVTPETGDIVFSYEATLHRYALIPAGLRCCLGRRMALIRPKEEYRYYLYLQMFSERWREVISAQTLVGATVDRIPIKKFPNFSILLPPSNLAASFSALVEPHFLMIERLTEQNRKLTRARDLLLPRLMDGRIPV